MFEKPKLKNKDKVKKLKEEFSQNKIGIEDIPKDILIELFCGAIEKIDEWENLKQYGYNCNDDERDWKDLLCDKEFIIDDLFNNLIEDIEIGVYESE